jgi:hypothetical protein
MRKKVVEPELFEVKHDHQTKPKEPDRLSAQTRMNDTWSKEKSPRPSERYSYTPQKTNTYWDKVWRKMINTPNLLSIMVGIMFITGDIVAVNRLPAKCPYPLLFGALFIAGAAFFIPGIWMTFVDND